MMKLDYIDQTIQDHAIFVAGWTDLDKRIVAHDFLNPAFGMRSTTRSMLDGDRRDAWVMSELIRTCSKQPDSLAENNGCQARANLSRKV